MESMFGVAKDEVYAEAGAGVDGGIGEGVTRAEGVTAIPATAGTLSVTVGREAVEEITGSPATGAGGGAMNGEAPMREELVSMGAACCCVGISAEGRAAGVASVVTVSSCGVPFMATGAAFSMRVSSGSVTAGVSWGLGASAGTAGVTGVSFGASSTVGEIAGVIVAAVMSGTTGAAATAMGATSSTTMSVCSSAGALGATAASADGMGFSPDSSEAEGVSTAGGEGSLSSFDGCGKAPGALAVPKASPVFKSEAVVVIICLFPFRPS